MMAKADYSYNCTFKLPFSLVSLDTSKDGLHIMPGYWFMYNMYALARNSWKYGDRDKRIQPIQQMEYDYLAPDTINEMFIALELLEYFSGKAFYKRKIGQHFSKEACQAKDKLLLSGSKRGLIRLKYWPRVLKTPNVK